MKRIGVYTGRIYTQEDFNKHRVQECCKIIDDEDAENEEYVAKSFTASHDKCTGCNGCPESQRYI